jgi:uncharacterized membrane protein YeaQ/YmgE (transglycosylase-associated protein family)
MPERSIMAWLAIGLVVGVLGKVLMPGKDRGGLIGTVLMGIGGALIAGFVAEAMHWTVSGTWQNYAASIAGAVVVLGIYRLVRNHRPG